MTTNEFAEMLHWHSMVLTERDVAILACLEQTFLANAILAVTFCCLTTDVTSVPAGAVLNPRLTMILTEKELTIATLTDKATASETANDHFALLATTIAVPTN